MLIFRFEWKRKRKYILIWAAIDGATWYVLVPHRLFYGCRGDFRDALGAVVTYRRVYGKYG